MIDYALAMRPFSAVQEHVRRQGSAAGDAELHVARADPLRVAAPVVPIFTASGSPAMNWPAGGRRSGPTRSRSCCSKHLSERPSPPVDA